MLFPRDDVSSSPRGNDLSSSDELTITYPRTVRSSPWANKAVLLLCSSNLSQISRRLRSRGSSLADRLITSYHTCPRKELNALSPWISSCDLYSIEQLSALWGSSNLERCPVKASTPTLFGSALFTRPQSTWILMWWFSSHQTLLNLIIVRRASPPIPSSFC